MAGRPDPASPADAPAARRCELDEDAVLRRILEGTATETGTPFFRALVHNLAAVLGTHGAWVTEYVEDSRRLRALAFWLGDRWVEDYEYGIDGTPCEPVVDGARVIHVPENVVALYPRDPDLPALGAVSYMGAPFLDAGGRVIGHLAVLDTAPMPEDPRTVAVVRIFAARAAAELRRVRSEAELREREEQLESLLGGALDAILELDGALAVRRANRAAGRLFGASADDLVGRRFGRRLSPASRESLEALTRELASRPEGERSLWIPGGLVGVRADGASFPAEATLARFERRREVRYALVLRDVNERLEAERRIRSLAAEAEELREEIDALKGSREIVGSSPALAAVLADVSRVAPTDATVLLLGETGTGKELLARAIHETSRRRERRLVAVNCAAIPPTLVESELFGHEAGAFTGASKRRVGRFAAADGGTLFLDEVGELPLEIQGKLLRVLQEGEVEPVGGSATLRVDVRVVAATNRDLRRAVGEGRFREDLYYRLAVFPIEVPPLRARGRDVVLLAEAFAREIGRRMGRAVEPLPAGAAERLLAYSWPGNVRELRNVIERAVILSRDARLDLDRALPELPAATTKVASAAPERSREEPEAPAAQVRTREELRALERRNILSALERSRWRVSGDGGAASLLGMRPSTLASRMKALGIRRPRDARAS